MATNLYHMRQRVPDRWIDFDKPCVPPITRGELTEILDELEQLRAQDVRIKRAEAAKEPEAVKGARELSSEYSGVVTHTIMYRNGEKIGEGTDCKPDHAS
jgi:hypothetical protein